MLTKWTNLSSSFLRNVSYFQLNAIPLILSFRISLLLKLKGLALTELDIIKAELYERMGSKEKRDQFIKDWESFVETCEDGLISPELISQFTTCT